MEGSNFVANEKGGLIKYTGSDKNVIIPSAFKYIDEKAFYNCDFIESIILPMGLWGIYESAFEGCTSLREIIIPYPTNWIEKRAFARCKNLKKIVIKRECVKLGVELFSGGAEEFEIEFHGDTETFKRMTKAEVSKEVVSSGDYHHPTSSHWECHEIVTYGHVFSDVNEGRFTCKVHCKDGELVFNAQTNETWTEQR